METQTITVSKKTTKDTAMRILSVVGGIAVLAGVMWVGIQGFRVLPNARQTLANALVSVQSFFSPAERIVLSVVDSQVVVEEPFTLTWERRGTKSQGSYAFFYECRESVHFALNGNTVFCNTELPLLSTDTTLKLTAHGTVVGVENVPTEIRFRQNGSTDINERGTISIAVQDTRFDDGVSTTTATTTPTTPTVTPVTPVVGPTEITPIYTGPVSDPNGKADLVVRVLAYGLVDKNSGAFTEKDEIPYKLPSNKRGAIKFVVENVGTKLSGEWAFEAALPTSPAFTYKSKDQVSLYPGDKIEFVIGFDKLRNADEDDYRIEVDSNDDVSESNEKNNTTEDMIQIDR